MKAAGRVARGLCLVLATAALNFAVASHVPAGPVLELSDGDLTLGFSAKGATLVKAAVGGVDYAHGMSSFGDRVIQERKTGVEMMEDLFARTFRQDERYERDGRKGIMFSLDSTGFKGLQYRKRYELTREGDTHVLRVVFRVNNNSGAPITLVHSTRLFLLVGDGRNTFLMPTSTGEVRRYEYPGCESKQITEFSPKHCGFGVMADNGAGVVFYAPTRRTGGFDSWLAQSGTPCVTEEYWGVNDTIEPGKGLSYVMRLVFTKDVKGHLATKQTRMGSLLGAPSMHLKKFASPPMKVSTINVGEEMSASFKSPREYLQKAFKIPVDLLEHVNIADVGYHEPWLKPCDPVDILYVYNPGTAIIRNGKRLMSELAARMDLTFETVPMILEVMGTRGGKPYSVYPTYLGEKVDGWSVDLLRKASSRSPKVVLLQGHDFAFVQKEIQDMLAAFAKKGAGLVFVDCKNVPVTLCGKKRMRALESAAMMIPKMSRRRAGIVEFHAPPEGGTVSVVVNTQRHTLNPALPDDMADRGRKSLVQSREFPFGDYLQLVIAKAVRIASGAACAATFDQAGEKGLRIKAKEAGRFTLQMKFKDTFRFTDAEKSQALELKEGLNEVAFAPPALPGGVHICELRLVEDGGKVADAAAFRFDTPLANPVSLAFAESNRIFGAAAPVAFKALVGGSVPQGAKLVAELEDGDFRVIRRATRAAADGVEFTFAQACEPGRLERVVVRLVAADGRVLSKAVEEVCVRARPRDLRDTSAYITIDSNPEVAPLLRDLGFDFMINGFGVHPEAIRQTANLGMMSIPRGCAGPDHWFRPYRDDNPNGSPVRHPCFSSDAYRKELFKRIGDAGNRAGYDFYNVRYHWLGDECFLGSTVCYSPTCLADFRRAMEAKYGDIAKLNARWGSAFGSFADVMPSQLKELKDRSNLAPWLEHKRFMARQFAEKWVGGTKEALNAFSPGSFTGPTGTAVPGYGWDWSQMMKHIDAVGYYGGAQRKLIHDFAELYGRQILAGQCGGGYTHAQFDYEPYNYDIMWSGLLKGSNLAYHYYGAAIDGDFTPTSNMVYWATSLAELKGGIGKMWLSGTYDSNVSVLYSQPSLFAAMATIGKAKWQNSLNSWWRILSEMKVAFRFLPCEYLAKGVPEGMKVLVLPMSVALSDAERAAVAQFIARGGTVLADAAPGAYDEAGVKVDRALPGVKVLGESIGDYVAIDLGGAAGETASVKGAAVEEAKRLRGIVSQALAAAGVTPEVSVVGADGAEVACDAPLRRDGDTTLFAMHVDTFGSSNNGSDSRVKGTDMGRFNLEKAPKVVAHLPVKGHVYDVRARQYVGFTDTIATTLAPGYTRMYSVLKTKPEPVTVACPGSVKAGEPIRISFAAANAVGPQVFNVRIVDPDGKAPWRFRKNVRSTDGRGEYVFETAFNDTPGEWRAVVTHVNTGSSREVRFTVRL